MDKKVVCMYIRYYVYVHLNWNNSLIFGLASETGNLVFINKDTVSGVG